MRTLQANLLRGAHEEHQHLTSDEEIQRAGGVGPADRVEVAPVLPDEGRLSFATSDPRAVDLSCFARLTRNRETVTQPNVRRTVH